MKLLKKYITKEIRSIIPNVKFINSSRHFYHIRFGLDGDFNDFIEIFNKINIKIKISDKSVSKTYNTYLLEDTERKISIYWVNSNVCSSKSGSKLFMGKELTVKSLKLDKDKYDINSLINDTSLSLTQKYPNYIYKQLILLLNTVKNNNNVILLKEKMNFEESDLKVISKDFGEILVAIWCLYNNNNNNKYVIFPEKSNEKLIDLTLLENKQTTSISVKSGSGSKSSIPNILNIVKDPNNNIKIDNDLLNVFEIVKNYSAKEQMIKLHQYFKTDIIMELSLILQLPVDKINLNNIKEWIKDKKDTDIINKLEKWWFNSSTPRKFNVKDKERLILSPLGESIPKILNRNKKLINSFNNLTKKIDVVEININVNYDKIQIKEFLFKDNICEFKWPGYSSGNKLGFKIKY